LDSDLAISHHFFHLYYKPSSPNIYYIRQSKRRSATQRRSPAAIRRSTSKPRQLEEVLATQGIYPGGKVHRVLEKLIYDLTYNGIIKVSREHLSNKLEVGFNTISTAFKYTFKYMEQSKLFILSRNKTGKTNCGCRVILDVQHVNFESILSEVYHLNVYEIAIVKDEFKQPINTSQQIIRHYVIVLFNATRTKIYSNN